MTMRSVDFLHPHRTPTAGWVMLLAAAVALLASVAWKWQVAADQRLFAAAQAQREAQTQAAAAQRRPAEPTRTPAQRAADAVAPTLRQPWLPVLRALESVTEPPVHLLGLSIDPATGVIRLEGEAPTFEEAVRYVGALETPGLIVSTQLRSHEAANDPNTNAPFVRFAAQARWVAR